MAHFTFCPLFYSNIGYGSYNGSPNQSLYVLLPLCTLYKCSFIFPYVKIKNKTQIQVTAKLPSAKSAGAKRNFGISYHQSIMPTID